jgi:integrase
VRKAEWTDFDLEQKEWRIPSARMKMREPHVVPLSRQALKILRDLEPITASGRYVFPSLRRPDRPMSENALTATVLSRIEKKARLLAGI